MEYSINLSEVGHFASTHTSTESQVVEELAVAFEDSLLTTQQRLSAFSLHVRRQDIARFLSRYEIFKQILNVSGSIAECGVFMGNGLMTWLHFSSILEPYNHSRRIIGFDTFAGFPNVHKVDRAYGQSEHHHEGGFETHRSMVQEIEDLARLHDQNRPLGHIPKIELVVGDARQTIPPFITQNRHVVLSLLYLDFDLYEPTKIALEHLLPRVVKGGIVAFDELNCAKFPGETQAMLEVLGASNLELRRSPIDPYIAWFVR